MSTLSVAEARANFSKLVVSASTTHERFEVTRNGRREAVLLGADDYDGLIETVAILSDAATVAELRAGIQDLASGDTVDEAEMIELMKQAGRTLGE